MSWYFVILNRHEGLGRLNLGRGKYLNMSRPPSTIHWLWFLLFHRNQRACHPCVDSALFSFHTLSFIYHLLSFFTSGSRTFPLSTEVHGTCDWPLSIWLNIHFGGKIITLSFYFAQRHLLTFVWWEVHWFLLIEGMARLCLFWDSISRREHLQGSDP